MREGWVQCICLILTMNLNASFATCNCKVRLPTDDEGDLSMITSMINSEQE